MNSTKTEQLKAIAQEFRQLHLKVKGHIDERVKAENYVYANTYQGWIKEYNSLIEKYNKLTSAGFSLRKFESHDLSTTKKTVRTEIAKAFAQDIIEMSEKVTQAATAEDNQTISIPNHQMRVCFKTGVNKCPLNPQLKHNKVFIAMPFSDEYKDSYEYGVKIALEQSGVELEKANDEIRNKDIMCKVCEQIQSCGKVIANISGLNPNVMLELGLAYGLGKSVIVIKDKNTTTISDLGSIEYIEYAHALDLQQKLVKYFNS